ncbi:MAG: signal peptidase I [bacterium]
MFKQLILLFIVFLLGAISTSIYAELTNSPIPSASDLAFGNPPEQPSPRDRITESNILVYDDRVIIRVADPQWATFTDTNSMDPVIDAGANAIEIVPQSENDVQVGDIISYKSKFADGTIIHRIVYKGQDESGTYFVVKGDNNPSNDPGKIRFSQIERVVVGIIY